MITTITIIIIIIRLIQTVHERAISRRENQVQSTQINSNTPLYE